MFIKEAGRVSLSTMEVDFVDASELDAIYSGCTKHSVEMGIAPTLLPATNSENQAAFVLILGEATSTKANPIDVRVKYLCEQARRDIVASIYVKSESCLLTSSLRRLTHTSWSNYGRCYRRCSMYLKEG